MAMIPLCLILSATLSILHAKSQFFRYEQIKLSCAEPGIWTVRRNTSSKTSEPCSGFGDQSESSCILKDAYPSDSGVYWCESEGGKEYRNILNITVTDGVILDSPPAVTEGDNVTLRCLQKERYDPKSTSDFKATFFRNDVFIGTEPDGKMILPAVKKSDKGFYKCKHPTKGESPQSLLTVTDKKPGSDPTTAPPPALQAVISTPPPFISLTALLCIALVFMLYTAIIIVCVYAYQRWKRARNEKRVYEHLTMFG